MPAQASTSTAPQPASANTWLQQGPPGPPPGPPPAGKGGLGAQAATGAPGYGGASGYGQAGGSYAPGLFVFLFHNSEFEGYFRLSPWAMQHVEPQGYRQCWAPGLLWFLSLQAILFFVSLAGKATAKGGSKPMGQWSTLKHGWQNKAVAITGATFWQNTCIDLSIYHWKHFVFCFFVKNKINKCFELWKFPKDLEKTEAYQLHD